MPQDNTPTMDPLNVTFQDPDNDGMVNTMRITLGPQNDRLTFSVNVGEQISMRDAMSLKDEWDANRGNASTPAERNELNGAQIYAAARDSYGFTIFEKTGFAQDLTKQVNDALPNADVNIRPWHITGP